MLPVLLPCEVTYTHPRCGSLLVAPRIVSPLAGVQTRKLLLAKVEAVVPSGSLLAASHQVLTAAVSSPRSLPHLQMFLLLLYFFSC